MKQEADLGRSAPSLDPEDQARANWYGLISRLFYGPADPHLLARLGDPGRQGVSSGVEGAGGDLLAAWGSLHEAAANADPALVRQEYDALFVGVGKSEVSPYLSGYSQPSAPDRFLVQLRECLAGWGLARRLGTFEMEDHISGINDVMHSLIEDGRPLHGQRAFFDEFAYAGVVSFCAAVQKAPSASFYRLGAGLTLAFYEIEKAAFEMSDT